MSQGNGNSQSPPAAFPSNGQIPIIGQPATLKALRLMVVLQCNCTGKSPIVLMLQEKVACPSCHRIFTVGLRDVNQLVSNLKIGLVMGEPAAPPPLGESAS